MRTTCVVAVCLAMAVARPFAGAANAGPGVRRSRYLLLDSRIIASAENARLAVGTVTKHEANPLFVEDKPWEKRFDNLYGNVIHDDEDKLYKCWYSPFIVDRSAKGKTLAERKKRYSPGRGRTMAICYATSRDGLRWEKPSLGLVEYEGSKENNIVWRGPHGAGIFKDEQETDPARRYKIIFKGMMAAWSRDGVNWDRPLRMEGVKVAGDTHNNALWAPTLGKYVGMTRTWGRLGREVMRIESKDFRTWTQDKVVMRATDKSRQPYAMPVFFHGGVYLGLVAVHHQRPIDRVWTELAWSPDTVTWHRICEGTPLIPWSEKMLDYDYGCVYPCAYPVFLEDEIRLYYGASDYLHYGWRCGSLALATLRPDGFAGYEQVNEERPGVVTTTAIPYGGQTIKITADVVKGGSVRVSIRDDKGKAVSQAETISTTGTDIPLDFDGKPGASEIRLRFEFDNAKVYSVALQGES